MDVAARVGGERRGDRRAAGGHDLVARGATAPLAAPVAIVAQGQRRDGGRSARAVVAPGVFDHRDHQRVVGRCGEAGGNIARRGLGVPGRAGIADSWLVPERPMIDTQPPLRPPPEVVALTVKVAAPWKGLSR